MIVYILNFVLCSGLLLLVYRAFLGYENLYRFNRFYLLFSLMFSLVVPFITIGVQHIKVPVLNQQIINQTVSAVINSPVRRQAIDQPAISGPVHRKAIGQPVINSSLHQRAIGQSVPAIPGSPVRHPVLQTPTHNYLPGLLLTLYGIITLGMLLRFARNSYKIGRVVAKNATIPYQDVKLVLLNEEVTPHSFLKYVFINKNDYQNGLIEPEIICHEQTHVKQLHSLDVIVVELLQAVCWFNPFIPFYRKAMQLNHEFLADEAVIKNYDNTPAYQYLLLSKASQCGSLYLTSQFNYLATRKRLIMMTKTTSAKIALYKKLALAPLIVYALLLFCNKGIAQTARVAVKIAYKNMAIAMDKISLATAPAPEKPIVNKPLTTESGNDNITQPRPVIIDPLTTENSTNTQLQDAVSASLITENADNSEKLQQRIAITDTSAKKLPNVQKNSLRAPADIKIDGKATEWNDKFQAYNKATNIYYTLANDDKYLYLTVQTPDPGIINKILGGGVTFSINEAGKKNFKDVVSITYPILKKNNRLFLNFSAKPEKVVAGVASEFTQIDSFVSLNNKRLAERSKLIRVTGIKGVDTLISVYNQDGIKATSLFNNKMDYTYKLTVSLQQLGLDIANHDKFAYNITLPGIPTPDFITDNPRITNYRYIPPDHPVYSVGNPHGYLLMVPTDFWGEYTLAK